MPAVSATQVTTIAHKGNGVLELLGRYKLSKTMENIDYFQRLNSGAFDRNGGLLLDEAYILPIAVVKFNGKTIRSTLGINDYQLAKKIEAYNLKVEETGRKKGSYTKTNELWIPYELFIVDSAKIKQPQKSTKNKTSTKIDYSYLLEHANNPVLTKRLKGFAFYLISGHGGPDVGAIGMRDGNELHEDEYAYDVTIRLAKLLRENGADVYMIVQDAKDGIRQEQILNINKDERLINGAEISPIQIERLKQRTDIVNDYAQTNKKKYKHQLLLEIHIDSRTEDKRIDIFFYHRNGSISSEKLNHTLLQTIEERYKKAQPDREYNGKTSARDLFTLRNTTIDASFIELGNIQNPVDQLRFIQPSNRQAIANWLFQGICRHYKVK
jgi:N-acetylmuramoyl-L-alanine amidase